MKKHPNISAAAAAVPAASKKSNAAQQAMALPFLQLPIIPTEATFERRFFKAGFLGADEKAVQKYLEYTSTMAPWDTVILIDGSNFFYRDLSTSKFTHNVQLKVEQLRRLHPGKKFPVIVVFSKLSYKLSVLGTNRTTGEPHIDDIKSVLRPIASQEHGICFFAIDLWNCDKKDSKKTNCMERNESGDQCRYYDGGSFRSGWSHLNCEFDDVLLSNIYYKLKTLQKTVLVASFDVRRGGVLKDERTAEVATRELNKLSRVFLEMFVTKF